MSYSYLESARSFGNWGECACVFQDQHLFEKKKKKKMMMMNTELENKTMNESCKGGDKVREFLLQQIASKRKSQTRRVKNG